jgi:hypothetical protein
MVVERQSWIKSTVSTTVWITPTGLITVLATLIRILVLATALTPTSASRHSQLNLSHSFQV